MSKTLPRLRQDHQNVAEVLNLIESQCDPNVSARGLDLELIEAAILYFRQYFTRFHQPKEDLIFGHLLGPAEDSLRKVYPLVQDHRDLLKRLDAFEGGIRDVRLGNHGAHENLSLLAKRFVTQQREHLAAEEKYVYPEAERLLSAQHWAEVDSYLPDAADPLSQTTIDPAFAALVRAMPRRRESPVPVNSSEVRARREAVGIFSNAHDFQMAIDELLESGFNRLDLSLLANTAAVDEKLGHLYERVEPLEADPSVPRVAYVSPEAIGGAEGGLIGTLMYIGAITATGIVVASGGTLAALVTAIAIAGGTGGVLGTILAKWVGAHHGHYLQDQLDRGGLLLWVRIRDAVAEQRALDILKKHSGLDVHAHAIAPP